MAQLSRSAEARQRPHRPVVRHLTFFPNGLLDSIQPFVRCWPIRHAVADNGHPASSYFEEFLRIQFATLSPRNWPTMMAQTKNKLPPQFAGANI
jgi:hypothetical protein